MLCRPIRAVLLAATTLASASSRSADYSQDLYPPTPDVLVRLIHAAETHLGPRGSSRYADGTDLYTRYAKSAEYVGYCDAPYGRVHIAKLFYIRSSAKGSVNQSARGELFLVFADSRLVVRTFWSLDNADPGTFTVRGTRLILNDKALLDFWRPPDSGFIVLDGKPQAVPAWSKAA